MKLPQGVKDRLDADRDGDVDARDARALAEREVNRRPVKAAVVSFAMGAAAGVAAAALYMVAR